MKKKHFHGNLGNHSQNADAKIRWFYDIRNTNSLFNINDTKSLSKIKHIGFLEFYLRFLTRFLANLVRALSTQKVL